RAIRWRERLLVLATTVGAAVVLSVLRHRSLLPLSVLFLAVPALVTAWTLWLAAGRLLPERARATGLYLLPLLFFAPLVLVRVENGLKGQGDPDFRWRWSVSAEDRFLSERAAAQPATAPAAAAALRLGPEDWPGFRGPNRDGVVHGVKVPAEWSRTPPKALWRRRVGPGWSSMAVVGGLIFTQEQRGADEAVVCFDAATGREVWAHLDPTRFEEA